MIHGNRPVIPLHGILAKGTNASNQCHAAGFYKVATGGFLFLADAASHARDAESVSTQSLQEGGYFSEQLVQEVVILFS